MAERKRRLFNGFDVAVVLLVLGAAFLWFFVINRAPAVEETSFDGRGQYFIEVTNLTPDQIAAVEVGAALLEGSRHIPIGQVVAVTYSPFTLRVEDETDQSFRFEEVPGRYAMILTVETEVVETAGTLLAEGNFAIRGGQQINFTGPGFGFADAFVLGWER